MNYKDLGTVFLSTAMIVTPAASMQGCGFAKQHHMMSYSPEEGAKQARDNLRHIFAELYDLSFFVPSELNVPLITFDDRKGGDQWGTCVPKKKQASITICAYNIEMEQMAEASAAAAHIAKYYRELLADEEGNANKIKELRGELKEKLKDGPSISERFEAAYTGALNAGIVKQLVLEPSPKGPHHSRSQNHPETGM